MALKSKHPLRALSTPQLAALHQWINHYRRDWKESLGAAWLRAGAGMAYYSPELQQIRNCGGPSLIEKITFADVEALLAERRAQV